MRKKILSACLLALVLGLSYFPLRYFVETSRKSEALVNMASLFTFQKNYHAEFKKYSGNFAELGFQPEGNLRYDIYLSRESVPGLAAGTIPEEHLPFVEADHYRALVLPHHLNEDSNPYWIMDESGVTHEYEVSFTGPRK